METIEFEFEFDMDYLFVAGTLLINVSYEKIAHLRQAAIFCQILYQRNTSCIADILDSSTKLALLCLPPSLPSRESDSVFRGTLLIKLIHLAIPFILLLKHCEDSVCQLQNI